ncbi:MAG: iron ABC transporter [Planctomycetota bacterium]|nr:MAG: iron ABC transporter [Planctomycetota bacterium]
MLSRPIFLPLAQLNWDYNTQVVFLGTTLLGIAAGVVGAFMVFRKRALVGDVIGHSALPGLGLAFLFGEWMSPGAGRSTTSLMGGALLAGLVGAGLVLLMERTRRIKSDAALALVLSLFYGGGTVLFSIIQRLPGGGQAGLGSFLSGKTASLLAADVSMLAVAAVVLLGITLFFFKELILIGFDAEYAAAGGWPVRTLDTLLIFLVAAITVLGMQCVGLVLVVALLLTPASAARFWSQDARKVVALSGVLGGLSAGLGTLISATWPRLPAGAIIVLTGLGVFVISLTLGRQGGLWERWRGSRSLQQRILRDDVLRGIYEILEASTPTPDRTGTFSPSELRSRHSWPTRQQDRLMMELIDEGSVISQGDRFRLTEHGLSLARQTVRLHRLWELYLMEYANAAQGHVDLHADVSEHFLDPRLLAELEERYGSRIPMGSVPQSPHALPSAVSPVESH